jgi:hypothetical protein
MKKFSNGFLAITISFMLFSCSTTNQSELELPNTLTPTILAETPYPTLIHYPISTITLTPTLVQIPKSTFEADKAVTQTLVPPALCPSDTKDISLPDLETLNQSQDIFERTILETLNRGGIREIVTKLSEKQAYADITREDVTHDKVPELIIENYYSRPGFLSVFGCEGGQYKKLLTVNAVYEYSPSLLEIKDMNLNGMPDLVLKETTCKACISIQIFEWDGMDFQSLVRVWIIDPLLNEISYSTIADFSGGYAEAKIVDIDGNGTDELVLQDSAPSNLGEAYFNGPFRSGTLTFMWDGQYYSQYSFQPSPPEYRFQAVQDGDNYALDGNYNDALASYQEAIINDQLKGWSDAEKANLIAHGNVLYSESPTPTSLPPHNEDYLPLAAYAHFRIMVLHILNGHYSDAQTVYDTLQEKFLADNDGYPYVEMAKVFWQEYLNSKDIGLACQQAVKYADKHRQILIPLSGPPYGFWNRTYSPQDVCPFKDQ